MKNWKELPDNLSPEQRSLVLQMRQLKDQLELTTAALARRTNTSRATWTRYLNGKTFPSRPAVEAFDGLAPAASVSLTALWEAALGSRVEDALPESGGGMPPRRRRPTLVQTSVRAAVCVLMLLLGLSLGLAVDDRSAQTSSSSPSVRPTGADCKIARRDTHLRAGYSDTVDRLVALNGSNWDVVEVQCLLKYHGFDPGRADGIFGKRTEKAVMEFQRARGAVVDGIVGPQTWALLRR